MLHYCKQPIDYWGTWSPGAGIKNELVGVFSEPASIMIVGAERGMCHMIRDEDYADWLVTFLSVQELCREFLIDCGFKEL